jgi:tetratricopeptide (TPR) repeat protein
MRNGNWGEALAAIERGMEIALQIGARDSEVLAAVMQGQLAMRQGHLEEALGLFRRAMAAADAIGLPALQALGLCVTGTCYQQIGGDLLETALAFHDRTLNMMDKPSGHNYGAQLWTEIGLCAMAAGRVEDAKGLFEKALTLRTAPMHLMRPQALRGMSLVALAEGRIDDARRSHTEMTEYVGERQMQDHYVFISLTGAAIEAAAGNHEAALGLLVEAETLAVEADMKRLVLDIRGAQAASLTALGQTDEATSTRRAGANVMEEIAEGIRDDEIRRAFLSGATELLGITHA